MHLQFSKQYEDYYNIDDAYLHAAFQQKTGLQNGLYSNRNEEVVPYQKGAHNLCISTVEKSASGSW